MKVTRHQSRRKHSSHRRKSGSFIVRKWRKLSFGRRIVWCSGSTVAVILAMTLIMLGIRWVQYRAAVQQAQQRQEQFSTRYDFNPGEIVSDEEFFDSSSMTASSVQRFLNARNSACQGSSCLKNYRQDTTDIAADSLCKAFKGGKSQSAATIIDGVARSCGINQKVLITLLQKEQQLVSSTKPTAWQYKSAMGLSCPDDASCDPKYAGFFKQVYGSAKRFKYYLAHASEYSYHAGQLNYIAFRPTAACGGTKVFIENKATALLYIYTPYQPNAAALKAVIGEGDSCSSYGNRNFSYIYKHWFPVTAEKR
ncbi:MAG: hemagglutinin [Bifidobacterium aquikefiri]|uniref:hemagglutinin n=1 Tax=Bifidobacterium aquikefiri TaxID=1653207 RepID=UPI0039E9D643